jgi:benzil reductase ((S)-benzoin forming)
MSDHLVFITGASSGIGLAMARAVPYPGARVIDISRRGAAGIEHFPADLADPASWPGVAELFANELASFAGERAVLVHSAGTLEPIGFAGEVDGASYARQVLLDAAAPQVLGDAFLHAASKCEAPCTLLFIGSGAAHSVYEGWSAYGAGKAAVDQWVRTVGAEQKRRGGRCRALSVSPGVKNNEIQEQIRGMTEEAFPSVERFRELHRAGALRDPADAARDLWALVVKDTFPNGAVLDLREG